MWGNNQQTAFVKLKEAISQTPVLRTVHFSTPSILQMDASGVALGAVLSQHSDGSRQPIAYASRTLSALSSFWKLTIKPYCGSCLILAKFEQFGCYDFFIEVKGPKCGRYPKWGGCDVAFRHDQA